MALSISRTRCFINVSALNSHSRVCCHGIRGWHAYKEIRWWVGAVSGYHTGVKSGRRGCLGSVGVRRLAAPHLTAAVLFPAHLTPLHRHLGSVTAIFSKIFTVNAASPLSEESQRSSSEAATLSAPPDTTHNALGLDSAAIPSPDIAEESALNSYTESIVYIPPPPAPPEMLGPTLNALGEPTFESLGLGGWSPVGMMQYCLEFIHVSSGLPWWASIAVSTVILRTLIFPLVIKSQRNAAKMNNNLPQLQILQMKMSEARNSGDQFNAAKYGQEMVVFMKEKDLSPIKNIIVPLAQAPIFISMFMSLRKLSNMPLESFKDGGTLWFNDLTICDPFYVLPIITSFTMLATIELGTDGAKLSSQNMQTMKYVLRGLPLFILPFTINFPAAVLCYWVSTNIFSLVQVGFLKIPAVRDFFQIERTVTHKPETLPPKKGMVEGFQESWRNMKVSREIEERLSYDEMRFKRAGAGPIVRTYKHDPTKVINVQAKVSGDK